MHTTSIVSYHVKYFMKPIGFTWHFFLFFFYNSKVIIREWEFESGFLLETPKDVNLLSSKALGYMTLLGLQSKLPLSAASLAFL